MGAVGVPGLSPLGVNGVASTATINYIGSTSYSQTLTGSIGASTISGTLRTDILTKSGDRYLKGWTTTNGGTTINYNRGASVTLNAGGTLTLYPVYYADAKIVYSGANRGSTASSTYTTTVHASSTGVYATQTLRKDIFRKLNNIAAFRGWSTTNAKTKNQAITHADGASVTLTEGQTLTLYPLYTYTLAKTINSGTTSETILNVAKGKTATTTKAVSVNPASHISGYSSGEPFDITVYGWMWLPFSTAHSIKYRLGSGTDGVIISSSAKQGSASEAVSATKTSQQLTATVTVTFTMSVTAPSGYNTGLRYKCYVASIYIW